MLSTEYDIKSRNDSRSSTRNALATCTRRHQ